MHAKRLITGIKPTGDIHLANFLAVIQPAVALQNEFECFMFIADIHALNQGITPEEMLRDTRTVARTYLAAGLDPAKVTIFKQSAIAEHGQLAQLIGAKVGLGYLERSHAYKDSVANGKTANLGLFTYPVLMAADILLYRANVVPVGKDQYQHMEIARDLAQQVNSFTGTSVFVLPETLKQAEFDNIPGIDGRKMSKSYSNQLGLFESPEELTKKVMRITTDSKTPDEPKDGNDTLSQIYKVASTPEAYQAFVATYTAGGMSYKEAKEALLTKVLPFVEPIQQKATNLSDADIDAVLADGAERAKAIAVETMLEVRKALGMEA